MADRDCEHGNLARSCGMCEAEADIKQMETEIATLRAALAEAQAERDEARKNYQFMVERAADRHLDGYRELGARTASAEAKRDEWRAYAETLASRIDAAIAERDRALAFARKAGHLPGCEAMECGRCGYSQHNAQHGIFYPVLLRCEFRPAGPCTCGHDDAMGAG